MKIRFLSVGAVVSAGLLSVSALFAGCDDPSWDIRAAWAAGDSGETGMPYERATLFGVYDFLERYAGCRFYFYGPLGEIVPQAASLAVPCGEVRESPAFLKRMWYAHAGKKLMDGDESGFSPADLKTNPRRLKAWGFVQALRQRRYAGCPLIHSLRHLALLERFGKDHPEYFALVRDAKGKATRLNDPPQKGRTHVCWTSRVTDEIVKDFEAYFRGESAASRGYPADYDGGGWPKRAYLADHVSIFPDDGFMACTCEACSRYYPGGKPEGPGYATELIWNKTAEIGRRLKADGIPGFIEQSAYTSYRDLPKTTDLPDNIVVNYCCNGPWDELNPSNRDHHVAMVKAWQEKAHGTKVFLHNWVCKYSATNIPDLPAISPHACGSYYARIAPYANGLYQENGSDLCSHMYLSTYITAKVTWNPKFDYEAAIDEHHRLMFGPAAPEMKAFFDDCERLWVGRIMVGRTEMNALGPVQIVPDKMEIWRKIYTAEKLAEWTALFDRAEEKVVKGSLEARRVALMRRNILDPVVNGWKAFADWTDAAKEETQRKREGVRNLLDKEYSASFEAERPEDVTSDWTGKGHSLLIPFRFETNSTYRISFFIETEDVRPQSRHVFNGALIGVWTDRPQRWHFTYGNRAIIGSTGGRIAQSALIETGKVFETKGISVCLRGATGRMKVDGLIVEKVR